MGERPWILLSCCMSLDGFLSGGTEERLVLSSPEDLARVDAVRATCDAILVGAETVRADAPRLLVRDAASRRRRVADGMSENPAKVTITASGSLDPDNPFFTEGTSSKLVYCHSAAADQAQARLCDVATVVDAGSPPDLAWVLSDLADRGIERLMVEGGGQLLTQLLAAGLADELHLVVAPFFVGNPRASRFVGSGPFVWDAHHRARLIETRPVGDVVLMRYDLAGSGDQR